MVRDSFFFNQFDQKWNLNLQNIMIAFVHPDHLEELRTANRISKLQKKQEDRAAFQKALNLIPMLFCRLVQINLDWTNDSDVVLMYRSEVAVWQELAGDLKVHPILGLRALLDRMVKGCCCSSMAFYQWNSDDGVWGDIHVCSESLAEERHEAADLHNDIIDVLRRLGDLPYNIRAAAEHGMESVEVCTCQNRNVDAIVQAIGDRLGPLWLEHYEITTFDTRYGGTRYGIQSRQQTAALNDVNKESDEVGA